MIGIYKWGWGDNSKNTAFWGWEDTTTAMGVPYSTSWTAKPYIKINLKAKAY